MKMLNFLKVNRILFWILIIISTTIRSQNICDTLLTVNGDTIPCKISYVNDYTVFYSYRHKRNAIREANIPRNQLISIRLHSPGLSIPPQGKDTTVYETPVNLSEKNGIIYAAKIDQPPAFPGGINLLYNYLENTVTTTKRDAEIYGDEVVTVCYELVILDNGRIYGAGIKESCIQDYGLDLRADHLEREIMKQICLAGQWEPGSLNGENINMNIYLPIKFKVDKNKIVVYPSEYLYIFKHRKQ